MSDKTREAKSPILIFTQKLLIFSLVFLGVLYFSLPSILQELNEPLKRVASSERNKLLLLGLIQNPAALYKASEIEEQGGNLAAAKREMELAVGLVEMHAVDKHVMKRYSDRLEALNRKAAGQTSNPPR